jgi:peptide-methionine (S)-S-oxide reductase
MHKKEVHHMRIFSILMFIFSIFPTFVSAQGTQSMTDSYKKAIFAGGCFWCMEKPFDATAGVISTVSGYMGGASANPTYKEVSGGNSGHVEVLEVTYDPAVISYAQLLPIFWRNIDPLDAGGQFCDRGPQYRSELYFDGDKEQAVALASKAEHEQILGETIVTKVVERSTFYAAEDYHQDYYLQNPVRYKYYRWNCGRDNRLEELWGSEEKREEEAKGSLIRK